VDVEGHLAAVEAHNLVRKVDLGLGGLHELLDLVLGKGHREQADLGAVGVEDVGERGRDKHLEAEVLQRPGSVLARGAAAEVAPRDEDRIGIEVPTRLLGPVVEQVLAEA
jgi:hypothetical protein